MCCCCVIFAPPDRVEELENIENELRDELDQTTAEAEEAINTWEKQCQQIEEQLTRENEILAAETTRLKEALAKRSASEVSASTAVDDNQLQEEIEARQKAEAKVAELEEKLGETESKLLARMEGMQAEYDRSRTTDEAQRLQERARISELEEKNDQMRSEKAAVDSEVDKLKLQLAERDDEIRELFENVKLHQTNEISGRAAKLAAEALRKEVDGLRKQLEDSFRVVQVERTCRLAAEQDAKRVRADLAALLGVENTDENQSEIRRRTIEATEHFQRKEQSEIEELRASLEKALSDLDMARQEAQQAVDRALRAELQFSTVEEELQTVRSELKHAGVAREEIEEADATRRTSAEARIAALESDHISLRRFHASEMEGLRNELKQVTTERDRLAQAVQNAEASKKALLESLQKPSSSDLEEEVRLLRLENVSLLTQIAEETARTESRVREARAADRLANQTQVVVERELRLAAERSLAETNEDLAKLRRVESVEDPALQARMEELTRGLQEARADRESIAEQLAATKRQLDSLRHESRRQVAHLQAECQQAKQRASQLEEKGRFEAEVRAEVARLQATPSLGKTDRVNLADRTLVEVQPSSVRVSSENARLYDVIESLRKQIGEERKIHAEERDEMEDLLKLVVQQKMNLESLTTALQEIGGTQAVQKALEEARLRVEHQYGQSIHVG